MFMKLRDERGLAIVTAVLVSVVVLLLSVVVIGLAEHNVNQSSFDRKRVQAIDAAEAGINTYFAQLLEGVGLETCDAVLHDGVLPTTPAAEYDVTITLYSTWPPVPGTELSCPPATEPLGAVVTSTGTAVVSGSPVAVSRTMQSQVRMSPIYGGFNKAVFSNVVLDFQNRFTINGYEANDGDTYTNGNFSIRNNVLISGSTYAQGFADISQGVVNADVWANSYVRLSSGIQVFGDVTSSTSYINLSNNSNISGDAKAGTTVTGGSIDGSITQNSPQGPPPQIAMPQIPYNPTPWITDGYTILPFVNCATAKAFIDTMPVGNYVVRVSPACALSWGNNSTINIRGNLAIITDGSITTVNQTNWNSIGGEWTVFFIRPYVAGLNCASGAYNVNVSNNTGFNNGLKTFVYTPCTVNFGNNNAEGVNGQIIGGTVNITNHMTLNYIPILVPGFNLTGYNVEVAFLREITNPTT
jgi:cytoskeletal protein CcmA (bactofilin family)